jgi:hypothetical protein
MGCKNHSTHQLKQKCPPWLRVEEVDKQIGEHQDTPKVIHSADRQILFQNAITKPEGTSVEKNIKLIYL